MNNQMIVEIISYLVVLGSLFFLCYKAYKLEQENSNLKQEKNNKHAKDAAVVELKKALFSYQQEAGIEGSGNIFHAQMLEIMKKSGFFSEAEIFMFSMQSFAPYELPIECAKLMNRFSY